MKIVSIMTMAAGPKPPPTQADMEHMGAFVAEMRAKGTLIDTGGAMDGMLEMVISRKGKEFSIVDGPFAEAKEVVGGYAILEVADRDEAIEVTKRFLEVVGPDATCQLHEVMSPPPE